MSQSEPATVNSELLNKILDLLESSALPLETVVQRKFDKGHGCYAGLLKVRKAGTLLSFEYDDTKKITSINYTNKTNQLVKTRKKKDGSPHGAVDIANIILQRVNDSCAKLQELKSLETSLSISDMRSQIAQASTGVAILALLDADFFGRVMPSIVSALEKREEALVKHQAFEAIHQELLDTGDHDAVRALVVEEFLRAGSPQPDHAVRSDIQASAENITDKIEQEKEKLRITAEETDLELIKRCLLKRLKSFSPENEGDLAQVARVAVAFGLNDDTFHHQAQIALMHGRLSEAFAAKAKQDIQFDELCEFLPAEVATELQEAIANAEAEKVEGQDKEYVSFQFKRLDIKAYPDRKLEFGTDSLEYLYGRFNCAARLAALSPGQEFDAEVQRLYGISLDDHPDMSWLRDARP